MTPFWELFFVTDLFFEMMSLKHTFLHRIETSGLPRGQFSGPWLFSTAEARTINSSSSKKRQADARILIRHSTHAIALRSDPPLPRALRPLTSTERLLRTSGIVF